jgi:hypothetical protein
MTWKEERDALIAQTMAFVQSVTGKPADFTQFELPPIPAATPITAREAVSPRAAPVAATERPVTSFAQAPQADISGAAGRPEPTATTARQLDTPRAAPAGEATPERFTSIASQLELQRDIQAEIRSRVARFRAHQERFNRERQEYFSATLARLKASATRTPEE